MDCPVCQHSLETRRDAKWTAIEFQCDNCVTVYTGAAADQVMLWNLTEAIRRFAWRPGR